MPKVYIHLVYNIAIWNFVRETQLQTIIPTTILSADQKQRFQRFNDV